MFLIGEETTGDVGNLLISIGTLCGSFSTLVTAIIVFIKLIDNNKKLDGQQIELIRNTLLTEESNNKIDSLTLKTDLIHDGFNETDEFLKIRLSIAQKELEKLREEFNEFKNMVSK